MRVLKVFGSMFVWSTSVVAWVIGGLLAALFVGFVWLTATESGTHWLIGQANQRVDGLRIAASRGTLWRGLTLEALQYRQRDGLRLDARRIEVQLDWRQFWHLNLQLGTLAAADVTIHVPSTPTSPKTERSSLDLSQLPLKFPVAVDVAHLSLQRVALIRADGSIYRLDNLDAALQATHHTLRLRLHESAWSLPGSIQTSLQGDLSVGTTNPHRLQGRLAVGADLPQGWLETSMAVDGQLADVRADLSATWTGFDLPDTRIQARARITPERLVFERLGIDTLGGTVCARGQVDYADGLAFALTGKAEALDPGVIAPSLSGRLRFDFRTRWTQSAGQTPGVGQVDLTQVRGALAHLSLPELTAHLTLADRQLALAVSGAAMAGGSLKLDARLGLSGVRPVSADLTVDHLDLAPLLTHMPAGASARTRLKATVQGQLGADPARDARLDVRLSPVRVALALPQSADGPALHEVLTGDLQGAIQDRTVRIIQSDWRWGAARLTARGHLAWSQPDLPMSLKAALSVPDLNRVPWRAFGLPPAIGAVQVDTDLSGMLRHPVGTVALHARQLGVRNWRLERLELQGRIAAGGTDWVESPVDLQVTAVGLGQASPSSGVDPWLKRLTMTVNGRGAQQSMVLHADAPSGTLALAVQGSMQGRAWQGTLRRFDLSESTKLSGKSASGWGHWRLEVPARLRVSAQSQQLDTACVIQADSRLCLAGKHHDQIVSGSLTGNLALSLFAPWLPAGMQVPGRLTLDAQGDLRAGVPSGTVHIALPDSTFSVPELADGKPFAYRLARLDAQLTQGQVQLDYRAEAPRLLEIQGAGSMALAGQQRLNLTTRINVQDLGALAFAVPQATRISGRATADISVIGPLMQPRPSGRVQVRDLAFVLPDTGVGYDSGTFEGLIDPQGQLRFTGQITGQSADSTRSKDTRVSLRLPSGGVDDMPPNVLQIKGTGSLGHLPDWRIDARIDGNGVPVLRIPSLSVDASPNLTIQADQSGANIGGSVLLPRVTARIEKLPEAVVRSTPDLVIVGQTAPPKAAGYPVHGDVALTLGDAVSLAGMGFSSDVTGRLNVRLRPDKPLAAVGEIDLKNGVYKAYGQNLAIQSGQLIFVGPLTDPGLSVSASRTVDSNVVGLRIGGTLHDPKTTVFSQPSMPESDALSLLLTGRKLNSSSSTDASMLVNAITGLGVAQGDDIARDIGQQFGLDSVGLDTTGGLGGTRLTLGKRIGDNLLVRYAIGVTTGMGELITEYKLNRLFAIEVTASPAATGGDLIYRIH